jgi:hypothetical protein
MFAICALVVFLLGLFGAHIGTLNLMFLGLAFLAAHLLWDPFAARYPWRHTP